MHYFKKINFSMSIKNSLWQLSAYTVFTGMSENPAFVYYLYIIQNLEKIHMYDVLCKYFNIINSGFFFPY